jgi:arylsulfatase A-like enzyme
MIKYFSFLPSLFFALNVVAQSSQDHKLVIDSTFQKPNIIYILTDDLGYGDLGVFFQNERREINNRSEPWNITPYLDSMAMQGAMLEQYCAAPVCAPSRSSLLSGQSQGHANVRNNQFDKALADNYTIGNVLQMAGYSSVAIGKWGLQGDKKVNGGEWPAHPLKRGFDYYLGYIRHVDGHEHYPKEGKYRGRKELYENYKDISNDLDKCYTGDIFTAAAKKYIIDHLRGKEKDKPFFLYLAYDIPHAVLELPTQAYPEGFGIKGGLQWNGTPGSMINTASGEIDSYVEPEYANATYDDDKNNATPEVPWPDTYKRYATVNKRIDNMVHDILVLLRDLNIEKNTLVVFTSDNGPSRESYLPDNYVENSPEFFNSFGPFDGIKRDVWEGGVRMPTLAWWPGKIKPQTKITTGSISYDWLPTFTEAAGLSAPVRADGVSLVPSLTGEGVQKKSLLYIEYFQDGKTPDYAEFDAVHRNRKRGEMQMLRNGDTVAIRYDVQSADDDFEIYDIWHDPQQLKNLAKTGNLSHLQQRLKGCVLQLRLADSSAKRPYDDALIPADETSAAEKGWKKFSYQAVTPWISAPADNLQLKKNMKLDVTGSDKATNTFLFEGYVSVPADGKYSFRLEAQGKAFLRVHDIALIDEDYHYTPGTKKTETLHLAKGLHHIRLFYKRSTTQGKGEILLQWASEGKTFEDISTSIVSN